MDEKKLRKPKKVKEPKVPKVKKPKMMIEEKEVILVFDCFF